MKADRKLLSLPLALILASSATAGEKEELLKLKNTTVNLIDMLVQQGIIDKTKAEEMIRQAEVKASEEAKAEAAKEEQAVAKENGGNGKPGSAPVRVTYVPDFVKDEIRRQVRDELRDEVVKDVKIHAKNEQWGVPAALPDWVNRFKLSGDVRLRGEGDFFSSRNPLNDDVLGLRFAANPWPYANWQAVNSGKDLNDIRTDSEAYLNTSEDVYRYRMRLRLGLDAQIADSLKAGVRLASSNSRSPVSTNQTLGQTGQQYDIALDRAFLQYDLVDRRGTDWLTVWAGRTLNPWLSTDNLFDSDLSFEGVSGTVRLPLPGADSSYTPPSPTARYGTSMGYTQPNSLFLTGGAYPLQELQLSRDDKWLFGGQLGADVLFGGNTRFKTAVAYYEYRNIKARVNTPDEAGGDLGDNDHTAPQFLQKGNTLMQINDNGGFVGGDPFNTLTKVGLASGFQIFNAVATLDYGGFGDNHIILTADYAKNVGFDEDEILGRISPTTFGIVNYDALEDRTSAWQVRMDVGRPEIKRWSDWNAFLAYKYLERDAVLDAFTDSDFHLGGTNARGWVFGANYGLAKNTWLTGRWMSADQIDGPDYAIDVLMVDLNARF
ncbi:MAG TPA: putative porin [Methylococcaceae bacterium]|nr:putative porin [Methylococcaceae bacterium]